MKKCFITSIVVGSHFKNYDMPGKFPKLTGYDYFLFTNLSPENLDTSWEIKEIKFKNNRKSITNSRYIKFQGWELLEDYDIIIHLDSYLRPIDNKQIWDKIVKQTMESKNGIIQSRHPIRDCPYEECIAVYKAHKDSKKNIQNAVSLMKEKNIVRNSGLWENNGFCYYTKNKNVKILFNKLWDLLKEEKYSHRDQIMYMLAIHLTKIKPEEARGQGNNLQGFMRTLLVKSGPMGKHTYK